MHFDILKVRSNLHLFYRPLTVISRPFAKDVVTNAQIVLQQKKNSIRSKRQTYLLKLR